MHAYKINFRILHTTVKHVYTLPESLYYSSIHGNESDMDYTVYTQLMEFIV